MERTESLEQRLSRQMAEAAGKGMVVDLVDTDSDTDEDAAKGNAAGMGAVGGQGGRGGQGGQSGQGGQRTSKGLGQGTGQGTGQGQPSTDSSDSPNSTEMECAPLPDLVSTASQLRGGAVAAYNGRNGCDIVGRPVVGAHTRPCKVRSYI